MKDKFERDIKYMRISITDRCNLRCIYCVPTELENKTHDNILRYEEIINICKYAVELGITRFKVTGGEPLVRKGAVSFISELKNMKGVQQVTLTTNALLLGQYLDELKSAGIDGINISLDTCNEKTFNKITGSSGVSEILDVLKKCVDLGIKTKINCVPLKGYNENDIYDLIEIARNNYIDVRFIEVMPIGFGKGFVGIKSLDIKKELLLKYKNAIEIDERRGNGPANYIKIPNFKGCIGFIDAIHDKFCGSCNRVRLTSDGYFKPCLFYNGSVNLRDIIRQEGYSNIKEIMEKVIINKDKEHYLDNTSIENSSNIEENSMREIGG